MRGHTIYQSNQEISKHEIYPCAQSLKLILLGTAKGALASLGTYVLGYQGPILGPNITI